MLRSDKSQPTLAIAGVNQQDFSENQLVAGCFPYQQGLQQRFPGKTLIEQYPQGIGSIYIFYLVYGRSYTFLDFGSITINPIVIPPIILPALPPIGNDWYDDFSGYLVDTISNIYPAGNWQNGGIGICETIILGYFDPFGGIGFIAPSSIPYIINIPIPPSTPVPGSPLQLYPPGTVDIVLLINEYSLWPPENDETDPIDTSAVDFIQLFDHPSPPDPSLLDSLYATTISKDGETILWNGLRVGRQTVGSYDIQYSMGAPYQPHWNPDLPYPPPNPTGYYKILTTSVWGVE